MLKANGEDIKTVQEFLRHANISVTINVYAQGVTELKPGQRVEFGVVSGRKGNQAMQVRLLDPVPSVVRAQRKPADEMAPLVEDLIKLLDEVSNSLRRGRYPDKVEARKVAGLLRAFADNLDA